MNFAEYQLRAREFALYEQDYYPLIALAEETGEFLGLFAKVARGDDMEKLFGTPEKCREKILKEAGDVLWQLSQCLAEIGLSMQDAAELNIQKLEDRKQRGVIQGRGDDR